MEGIRGFPVLALILPLLGLAILIPTAIWVYKDAASRGIKEAALWTFGSAIAWPIVLILYLTIRQGQSSDEA